MIGGSVSPGFEPVREAFVRNFAEGKELGAAVAVYRGTEPLVDLWGGYRDLAVVPTYVVSRLKGGRPPNAVWGLRRL